MNEEIRPQPIMTNQPENQENSLFQNNEVDSLNNDITLEDLSQPEITGTTNDDGNSEQINRRNTNRENISKMSKSSNPIFYKPSSPMLHDGSIQEPSSYSMSFNTNLILLATVRLAGALYSNINDCDEVFNFWEPTHFLQHGWGLQTWEYAPIYAIRSYVYLLIHYLPLSLFQMVSSQKITQFYLLRCLLSFVSAYAECWMVQTVFYNVSNEVATFAFWFLLFSPGMFHAPTAYLPSTFAMVATTLFYVSSLKPPGSSNRLWYGLVALAVGSLVGWPFAAAIGIPFVLEELILKGIDQTTQPILNRISVRLFKTIMYSTIITLSISVPMVLIDNYFYGRPVLVPWNIVSYNVLGAGSEAGPNIFGTEPWHYYLVNLILNYNIVFIISLISLPLLFLEYLVNMFAISGSTTSHFLSLGLKFSPMYFWLFIFTIQPHKEERFMFIIYPLIAVNAAASLSILKGWVEGFLTKIYQKVAPEQLKTKTTSRSPNMPYTFSVDRILILLIYIPYSLLSLSRVLSQYFYYYGTLAIYLSTNLHLQHQTEVFPMDTSLCVGNEWYRFPSHYFLPDNVKLRFIKEGFDGLLPTQFSSVENNHYWTSATKTHVGNVNNKNLEEMDRYVDVSSCDYKIESLFNPSLEPHDNFLIIKCHEVLDPDSLPSWRRAFYIPTFNLLSNPRYRHMCLLQRIK